MGWRSSIAVWLLSFGTMAAQEANDTLAVADTLSTDTVPTATTTSTATASRATKYVAVEEERPHLTFFQGFTLSADIIGPAMWVLGSYGTAEAALRLNLRNTYFPVAEVGYAMCDTYDPNTYISYQTKAPYLRAGIDFNLLKDKFQENRFFVGARYGMSVYNFDVAGPPMTDDVWGGSAPFAVNGLQTTSHWMEIVVGVQVKIWRNFHMGWSVRYKRELSSTDNKYARPYYIPGYGTTTTGTTWGGTYNLVFDLNWGKAKSHRRKWRLNTQTQTESVPTQTDEDINLEQETNENE